MKKNKILPLCFLLLLFLGTVLFSTSCSQTKDGSSTEVVLVQGDRLTVLSPQASRDSVIDALNNRYDLGIPKGVAVWTEKNLTPQGVNTSAVFEFTKEDWVISVVSRVGEPEERNDRVSVTNSQGFEWHGRVDAYGEVTQTEFIIESASAKPTVHPPAVAEPQITLTLTPTPQAILKSKTDSTYRLEFQYPSSWKLTTLTAGRNIGLGFGSKAVELTKDDITLLIQYKTPWDKTDFVEDIPIGDIEIKKLVSLLGTKFPLKFVLQDDKLVYQFVGASFADLEFQISIETSGSEITETAQLEAEQIISSISRSGDPLPSPTVSPTPKPTSKWGSTRSGGGGSGVGEDCNKANFVSHVTFPEGSILPPGVKFTKTWRIQNVGVCTWTEGYRLVYSTGDRMGANMSVPFPESVSPGSSVDISVDFNAPEKEGRYQGYWIFNDPQGYWFGLGEQKNGFIPVDIRVLIPEEDYTYNFAYDYCDATWENNDEEELPCPGNANSSNGFVILVINPELENRNENQLTLWVHPNEERYGWIRGEYPKFDVQNGDHFKTWVGCLADSEKCSLNFHLEYMDSGGEIHSLGSWIETYDGKVTMLDIDLSTLAGETVRFILRTEAMTKNVSAAQGFWFVPRIERP
jgi:hypothetical protein